MPDFEQKTRNEVLLNAIAENTGGGTGSVSFTPVTREEHLLDEIRRNTEGGGGSGGSGLPDVTAADNGKVLGVDNGQWGAMVNLPVLPGVTSTSITPDVDGYIRSGKPFIVGNMVVISGGYNVGDIPAIAIGGGTVRKGILLITGDDATRFISFYDGSDLSKPEDWPKYNNFPVILTEGEDAETIFTFLLGMKSVAGSAGNAEWFVPFPNAANVVSFVRTYLTDGSVPIMVYDAGQTNVMRLQFVSDTPNGVTFHGELVDPVSSGNSFTGLDTYPFDMTFCNYGIGVAMTHKEFAAVPGA